MDVNFSDIFSNQKYFNSALRNLELPAKDYDLIRESSLGIFTELGEALAVDKGWKTWRKDKPEYSESDLKEEIADIWIFLVNYTLANGIDFEEIGEEIVKKQLKNLRRFLDNKRKE